LDEEVTAAGSGGFSWIFCCEKNKFLFTIFRAKI
jgi:hypothetical protein